VGIKVGDPELTFLGNAQIIQSVSDVRFNRLPEKPGIGAAQVLWIAKPELLIDPGLPELGKQRRYFAQIVDIGQLPDQIRGTQKAWIVASTAMLFVLRNGKSGVLYIPLNLQGIDVAQGDLAETLAHEKLRSGHVIGGQPCVGRSIR